MYLYMNKLVSASLLNYYKQITVYNMNFKLKKWMNKCMYRQLCEALLLIAL